MMRALMPSQHLAEPRNGQREAGLGRVKVGRLQHAWLIEDLPGNRVRILTQETQKGKPAAELARTKPNPMINGHQDWIEGLAQAALKAKC
ncbi:hypothetical protein NP537_14235 [Pseudomonas kurunegalensis]|nr:hypothetical protein [Pseudomonas kurunegalensis]